MKIEETIPPAVRGDAKWRDACIVLTLAGDKLEVRGEGGKRNISSLVKLGSGAYSWDMCAFILVMLY